MRGRVVWGLLFFWLSGFACSCSGRGEAGVTKPSTPPVMELSDTVLDFGRMRSGETLERLVRVGNAGGSELRVEVEPPSCNCLSVRPMECVVPAGGKATLRIALNGRGMMGNELKWIHITSNALPHQRSTLYVLAVVDGGVQFELVNN